ncbi:hypothetical protein B0J13DRAFT_528897 [Dactylonectria estremocensis]|uniref:Uncharacterized protein n=1 Tax=Dactylonectria estremocensis TaxID=1079267 RepID=A0A9P9EAG1_9HYPO|nr:hypothetical protein B0J13DRAFT_528897 [Dactylonectria estremocensis]
MATYFNLISPEERQEKALNIATHHLSFGQLNIAFSAVPIIPIVSRLSLRGESRSEVLFVPYFSQVPSRPDNSTLINDARSPATAYHAMVDSTRHDITGSSGHLEVNHWGRKQIEHIWSTYQECWGYDDALGLLEEEFALHGLESTEGWETADHDTPLLHLYKQVRNLIENHYIAPLEDNFETHVYKAVEDTAKAVARSELKTAQQIDDALPSHAEVLAIRFIDPCEPVASDICLRLMGIGQAHLLQITAIRPESAKPPLSDGNLTPDRFRETFDARTYPESPSFTRAKIWSSSPSSFIE